MNDAPIIAPIVGVSEPTGNCGSGVVEPRVQGQDCDNSTRKVVGQEERRIAVRGPFHSRRVDGERLDRSLLVRELPDGYLAQYAGGPYGSAMTLPEALVWALEQCGVEVDIRPLTTNDNCQFVMASEIARRTQ